MQSITEEQLNYWIVDLGKKLSKQFNLDNSALNVTLQKSAKELGIYNLNTTIKTVTAAEKSQQLVTREQVETWFKAPGKGGLKIGDLKQKATDFGLDHKLKKEELKDAFMRLTGSSSGGKEEQTTTTTTNFLNKGVSIIVCRHASVKAWIIKGTDYVIKSPKERWVVGKVQGDRVVDLTFQDRALCHTNGWRLEKGAAQEDPPIEGETIDLTGGDELVTEECQVIDDLEEDLEEDDVPSENDDDGGGSDYD